MFKIIFLPTWKRLVLTILLAPILTGLGLVIGITSVHGYSYSLYLGWMFYWPMGLLSYFNTGFFYSISLRSITLSLFIQFVYYYTIFSLIIYFKNRK